MFKVDRSFLENIKEYMEQVEIQIEWEWGSCRSLEELIKENHMSEEYYRICEMLKSN